MKSTKAMKNSDDHCSGGHPQLTRIHLVLVLLAFLFSSPAFGSEENEWVQSILSQVSRNPDILLQLKSASLDSIYHDVGMILLQTSVTADQADVLREREMAARVALEVFLAHPN